MFIYSFLLLFNKKIRKRVSEIKYIIPVIVIMVIETIVCRIGFDI
jgi:hypothetical protein